MEIRQLRHFEALYRLRSFRVAADDQNISDSALTKSLQKFEEQLGLRLFDRTTRAVVPTPAGERLIDRARTVLSGMSDLSTEAKALVSGSVGPVRVGATPQSAESLLVDALSQFTPSRPDLRVEVVTGQEEDLIDKLMARKIDFAIRGWIDDSVLEDESDVLSTPIGQEPSVIVAKDDHKLIEDNSGSEAYLNYMWSASHFSDADYRQFPEPFRSEMRARGIPQVRLDSVAACIDLARRSEILTGVAHSIGQNAAKQGGIALVPYPFPITVRYSVLQLKGRSLLPSAEEFLGTIMEAAGRLS